MGTSAIGEGLGLGRVSDWDDNDDEDQDQDQDEDDGRLWVLVECRFYVPPFLLGEAAYACSRSVCRMCGQRGYLECWIRD
jgi:hypothetical protein